MKTKNKPKVINTLKIAFLVRDWDRDHSLDLNYILFLFGTNGSQIALLLLIV